MIVRLTKATIRRCQYMCRHCKKEYMIPTITTITKLVYIFILCGCSGYSYSVNVVPLFTYSALHHLYSWQIRHPKIQYMLNSVQTFLSLPLFFPYSMETWSPAPAANIRTNVLSSCSGQSGMVLEKSHRLLQLHKQLRTVHSHCFLGAFAHLHV